MDAIFYLWLVFAVTPVNLAGDIGSASRLSETIIHDYTTLEECESEAKRILSDMKMAYPEDKTMETYCTATKHKKEIL